MDLILGVIDVAYSDQSGAGANTTAEVAQILENRYAVMATFYYSRQDKIAEWLAESVANAIEMTVVAGRNMSPTFEAEQNIEAEFRAFLDADEMSKMVAGLSEGELAALGPGANFSGAAQAGVNHRKKHPYSSKNKARPAFIDTGLYQQSFRAWIE